MRCQHNKVVHRATHEQTHMFSWVFGEHVCFPDSIIRTKFYSNHVTWVGFSKVRKSMEIQSPHEWTTTYLDCKKLFDKNIELERVEWVTLTYFRQVQLSIVFHHSVFTPFEITLGTSSYEWKKLFLHLCNLQYLKKGTARLKWKVKYFDQS